MKAEILISDVAQEVSIKCEDSWEAEEVEDFQGEKDESLSDH